MIINTTHASKFVTSSGNYMSPHELVNQITLLTCPSSLIRLLLLFFLSDYNYCLRLLQTKHGLRVLSSLYVGQYVIQCQWLMMIIGFGFICSPWIPFLIFRILFVEALKKIHNLDPFLLLIGHIIYIWVIKKKPAYSNRSSPPVYC